MSDYLLLTSFFPVSVSTLAMRGREISTSILSLLTPIQTHTSWYDGRGIFSLVFYYTLTQTQYPTHFLIHTHALTVGWLKGQVIGSNSGITCQPQGILTEESASAKGCLQPFSVCLCTSLYLPLWKLTCWWLLFTNFTENLRGKARWRHNLGPTLYMENREVIKKYYMLVLQKSAMIDILQFFKWQYQTVMMCKASLIVSLQRINSICSSSPVYGALWWVLASCLTIQSNTFNFQTTINFFLRKSRALKIHRTLHIQH